MMRNQPFTAVSDCAVPLRRCLALLAIRLTRPNTPPPHMPRIVPPAVEARHGRLPGLDAPVMGLGVTTRNTAARSEKDYRVDAGAAR